MRPSFVVVIFFLSLAATESANSQDTQNLDLNLQSRVAVGANSLLWKFKVRSENWNPNETALIVCDFWDYHHCLNAVRRMKEFGPRLNEVVKKARSMGVTIVHSPSDCMNFYRDHPARKRCMLKTNPIAPEDAEHWCSRIPGEEAASFPIDQSDGGEDDAPAEHAAWAMELEGLGRNPNMPWKKQNDMIRIDPESDFISSLGDEVWSVLESRGIKNVILTGVHTNMCVLGRPFGIRQMKRNGLNVVLMRDMTDSMYNPKRWPYVSHHAGNGLVISHIEKHVCPTISSNQIIGGDEFHFPSDDRPHLVVMIGEAEYMTEQTLPDFVERHLRDFRVS